MAKLTDKQELFCQEYLIDFNGARAARAAGYAPDTADRMAYENLRKPEIESRIEAIKRERFARLEMDGDWTLRELETNARLARAKGDLNAANAAIAQIVRIRGENDDRLRVGALEQLSDAELEAIVRGD